MAQKSETGTCVHPPCGCKTEPGHLYCSDACDGARDDENCACGHGDCAGAKKARSAA